MTFRKTLIFSLLFLLIPMFSFAQEEQQGYGLEETGANLPFTGTPVGEADTQVAELVGNIINAFLGIVGVVFLIYLIYAGSLWLTAGGNAERVTKGRKIMTWSILGLIIIFAAYVLTNFIIGALVQA